MNLIFFNLSILFIIINAYSHNVIKEETKKNYIELPFNRNLTITGLLKPEELFKSLFYNQIYINMKVGSQKIEIPFYFYLQQYSFIVQSSEVSNDEVKGLYNESSSTTYKEEYPKESFTVIDMYEGTDSKDLFFLNNEQNGHYFRFYLCTKNNDNTHIPEGGRIGFKFEPECLQNEDAVFITNLKKNDLISELIFSFKYDSEIYNEDKGKFYIGTYPHIFDEEHYDVKYFINDNAEKIYGNIQWAYYFDNVQLNNNIIENRCQIYFYIEIGYIVGTKKFLNYLTSLDIWKEYFNNNKKCHETKFMINDFEKNDVEQKLADEYTLYYCDKDVDITKINIGELSFVNKNMNYTFYFSSEELWAEEKGYKYFKIIFPSINDNYWFFGKPFFKKYQMIFDYDNKKIGLYTKMINKKEKEQQGNKAIISYIIVIIGLSITVVALAIILYKFYYKLSKRKKAYELDDDNYDYIAKNKDDNNAIN